MLNYRKIGGLHFIRIGRYQVSLCRLRATQPTRYTQAANDEWHLASDLEPRHHNRQLGFITRVQHSIHSIISRLAPITQSYDDGHALDRLDSSATRLDPIPANARIDARVTRFLQSPQMREAREIESVLLGFVALPVVLIWSVMLIELADRMKWF